MPMNDTDPDRHRQDYASLGLDESADWPTAHDAYRRHVNVWHPDRYVDRPREHVRAQKRFISLTRSFDRLRAFHRLNGRLPMEMAPVVTSGTLHERRVERSRRERLEHEALERPEAREGRSKIRRRMLLAGVVTVVLGTLAAVAAIDGSERRSNREIGREVLRDTPPSAFMPSREEIRNGEARGAFIEREQQGKPGDRLMRDVFR